MNLRNLTPFGGRDVSRAADSFSSLQREINRAFDDLWRGAPTPASRAAIGWMPSVDVKEEKDQLVVHADLPGVSENDVSLQLDGDVLSIRGERRSEKEEKGQDGAWHIAERSYGAFSRAFTLPFVPPSGGVEATFKNGVLTVTIRKPAAAEPANKAIPIKAG